MAQSKELKNLKARIRYHNRMYGTRYHYQMFMDLDIDPSKVYFTKGQAEFDYSSIGRTKQYDKAVLDNFLEMINSWRGEYTNTSIEYAIRTIETLASSVSVESTVYAIETYQRAFGNVDYSIFYDPDKGISPETSEMITHILNNAEDYVANKYGENDEEFEDSMVELEYIREKTNETFAEDVYDMFL